MLTPRFEITQTDTHVVIIVHAPYANIKDSEVIVDGTDFRFYSTPYYLRLNLPGKIMEDSSSSGAYNCETGDFTLQFSKVNKEEHFENLDMITYLLAPPKKKRAFVPTIEVIGNPSASSADIDESSNDNGIQNNLGNEWFISQNYPTVNIISSIDSPKYGFANKLCGALIAFESEWISEIIDLPFPDTTPAMERKILRESRELKDFNDEHYMADLMEPEFTECIEYKAEWDTLQKDEIEFSATEVDLLKDLPNKEYLLEAEDVKKLCFNIIDILYANCYNHRTTLGENTVQSGWTINKLSSTLCWFQDFFSIDEVVTACFRRSLCYPLYRNWELSMKILEDVKKVIRLGKKYIIKRFCETHILFNKSHEPRYILNQLYIKDFLIWLQTTSESLMEPLLSSLDNIQLDKANMGLQLVELEVAAKSVQQEELVIENIHKIVEKMDELSTNDKKERSPNNSSSTDSSDSDTDSASSTTSSSTSLDSDDEEVPNKI